MAGDTQSDLEDIRKRLKQTRARSIAAVVMALVALLILIGDMVFEMWLDKKGHVPGKYFVLVGPDGKMRGAFDALDGTSSLLLHDVERTSGVGMRVDQDGTPRLRLRRDGEPRVDMSVPSEGGPFLKFNRPTGKMALACGGGAGHRSYLVLCDSDGDPRVLIEVDPDGSASIQIRDEKGDVVWQAP